MPYFSKITPVQLSFSTIFCEPSSQFLVFWFTSRSQLFSPKVRIIDFDELNLNLHLILYSQVHSNILSSPDFILDNIVKSSANIGDPKYTLMKSPWSLNVCVFLLLLGIGILNANLY